MLTGAAGGDTGAPEVALNPIPRAHYHTDWVADRTIAWLRSLDPAAPFFCWMSFPDPHHPFDPPRDEVKKRGDFRGRPLPSGHPGSAERVRAILAKKPRHWLDFYEGRFRNPEGGPTTFVPAHLTHDQLREIELVVQVENELVDEAVGRVLTALAQRGQYDDTDVFFTSDHGDLGGHAGLIFKGPYHIEALMRVPLVWRPAPNAAMVPAVIDEPVGHVDLAPTFCAIAGIAPAGAMQGQPLPTERSSRRERVITTFDSQFARVGMHLRTLYRDGMICTAYEPSTVDRGGRFPVASALWLRGSHTPRYDGSEGELYDLRNDPEQWENRWADPSQRRCATISSPTSARICRRNACRVSDRRAYMTPPFREPQRQNRNGRCARLRYRDGTTQTAPLRSQDALMPRYFLSALALLACLAAPCAQHVAAQGRFDFDTAPGNLPKTVVPVRYVLVLDLDPARDGFTGRADIVIDVRQTGAGRGAARSPSDSLAHRTDARRPNAKPSGRPRADRAELGARADRRDAHCAGPLHAAHRVQRQRQP